MTQLLLCYFDRIASVHNERCNGMTESMEPAARDSKRVEDRPQSIFHNLVRRRWPAVSRNEEIAVWIRSPVGFVLSQNCGQSRWQGDWCCASFALCGLRLSVPRRAANMNALAIEV